MAGRLAQAGKLSKESTKEQSSAQLTMLTPDEQNHIDKLNCLYKEKFGFPFVICARLNKKESILKGLEKRLENSQDVELQTGIEEVMKICELRTRDIIVTK